MFTLRDGLCRTSPTIGEGKDENEGRAKAFENAKNEFARVCRSPDDCKGHTINIHPERTACEKKNTFKCYRLIVFSIGEKKEKADGFSSSGPAMVDIIETFEPFTYESVAHLPKIKNGMTKAAVFELFGAPFRIEERTFKGRSTQIVRFNGKMCMGGVFDLCSAYFFNGKVIGYENFKPIYTEDIK